MSAPSAPADPATQAVSVAHIQAIDRTAIEQYGIPRLLLMEHAGLAIAQAAQTLQPRVDAPLAICCGPGFNGGDGFAAARHLHEWGYPIMLIATTPREKLRDEPQQFAHMLHQLGLEMHLVRAVEDARRVLPRLRQRRLLIDALLGVGAQGTVREPIASLIQTMNESQVPILAADIPSGLDADTGAVQGIAVRATQTVTFGRPKRGMFMAQGPAHTGTVLVAPITIPKKVLQST